MNGSETRICIAVIDDSPENLNLISSILQPEYDVRCSKEPLKAVDFIKKSKADLILLDAVMPDRDGYEVLTELRSDPVTRDVPVVFLTALTDDRHEQRALELGAVDFIRKPFNPVIVRARLKSQVDLLRERREVERLLENTLPRKVIRDLRDKGAYTPEVVPSATLLFTDIVHFTDQVAEMDAVEVISELTDMFSEFDRITERYQGTRIKTIGDAYFAVCGVESELENHADRAVQIALDVMDYIRDREPHHGHKWQIRIGLCSGSVTAGIVGRSKYLYDVFGDPVNIASRVESSAEPMHISACKATVDLISLPNVRATSRGLVNIKGRGDLELFYLDRTV